MQSFVILCRSSSVYLAGPIASSVLGVGNSSAGLEMSSAWGGRSYWTLPNIPARARV